MPTLDKLQDTMTVGQLRDVLAAFDKDLPIVATWEGLLIAVTHNDISIDRIENQPVLLLDVDQW